MDQWLSMNETTVVLMGAFLIAFIGYALGSIKVKGLSLGTAGVFLVALLFGYLYTQPLLQKIPLLKLFFVDNADNSMVSKYGFLESVGLILFVTSVGFIAGPNFFRNLRLNVKSYVPLGAVIIFIGTVLTVAFALIPGIGSSFSTGVMSGALTSTPAFSAAKAVAQEEGLVSLGHAIAYPFGVVGVVLFVQIVPKLLHSDMTYERTLINGAKPEQSANRPRVKGELLDEFGYGAFGLAVVLGIILGGIQIPLTSEGFSGPCFSLGNTGGSLIMALILGHFGHLGRLNLEVPSKTLRNFREFGLMLFLLGAGVGGGVELVAQIQQSEHGVMLVVYGFVAGVIMTVLPMLVGYVLAKRVLKLQLLNTLGSLTGGMTSTPALGTLIGVAGTDDVAAAYASTYPVALVLIVLASNLIGTFIP